MEVTLTHCGGIVEEAVRAFPVTIPKPFVSYIRDSKMGEVERIAKESKGNDRDRVQICAALEENKLESELAAGRRNRVARVIPPLSLRVAVSGQIARKHYFIVLCSVTERFSPVCNDIRKNIEKVFRRSPSVI